MKSLRCQSYHFRNGKSAKSRLIVPPMASETADFRGHATEVTFAHYERLAKANAGIIFVEYSFIHESGRSEAQQLGAHQESVLPGLSRIVKIIQRSGALAGLQLVHAGGKSKKEFTGGFLWGPSAIPVPAKENSFETPREMALAQIEEMVDWYLFAAGRAARAGFDFVELHAAHGYGLNQWLSPLTNRRQDKWGGDRGGRSQLLLQVVEKIRRIHPQLLIAVRLPGQDFISGGLDLKDTQWLAQELECRGLDLLDVSSGIGGWRRPRDRAGEGYLVEDASVLKGAVKIPVVGVGGIETTAFIEAKLGQRNLDFVAVGRKILEDPEAWRIRFCAA